MSKSTKIFGQFRVKRDYIDTVSGYPYIQIDRKDIINKNPQPIASLISRRWVSRSDLAEAYQYARRYYYQFVTLTKKSNPRRYNQMMEELNQLSWKMNAKGNHVTVTEQGDSITVFKDPSSSDRLKWVTGGIFSHSSYKRLDDAKKRAFKHYFLSKRSGK